MKFFKSIGSYLNPAKLIRYKDINIIISICIFVISSFFLGAPVGRNKLLAEDNIRGNYNFAVLSEIPNDNEQVVNVINTLMAKDCSVNDNKELTCSAHNDEPYENTITFTNSDGIKKNIHIVLDLFDISKVYIFSEINVYYNPQEEFIIKKIGYEEGTEDYLLRIASDTLYFQAHPTGIEKENKALTSETIEVYYQSVLPEFSISSEDLETNDFGEYILEQLIKGNENKVRLRGYTLTFLTGVLFTLITIIILWIFFRKIGIIRRFSEFYNIAAITSIPISIIYFILLWFIPDAINTYIYIFSLFYVIVLYKINSNEEIV